LKDSKSTNFILENEKTFKYNHFSHGMYLLEVMQNFDINLCYDNFVNECIIKNNLYKIGKWFFYWNNSLK